MLWSCQSNGYNRWLKKLLQCIPPQRSKRSRLRRTLSDGIKTAMTGSNLSDED